MKHSDLHHHETGRIIMPMVGLGPQSPQRPPLPTDIVYQLKMDAKPVISNLPDQIHPETSRRSMFFKPKRNIADDPFLNRLARLK